MPKSKENEVDYRPEEDDANYWPLCSAKECKKYATRVDNFGHGYCRRCETLVDPAEYIPAWSIYCFDPVWVLGMYLENKGIDTDLLSLSEREQRTGGGDTFLRGPMEIRCTSFW